MAVNMPDFDFENQSFAGLIGDGTDTIDEKTSPNFRSYHLESKAFTDIFPNADVLPYGKPRVALQKVQPTTSGENIESGSSSNQYTRKSSLKFSDRSNANSNIVRYTSFNDSKLPFKDLQANDGEIFYLVNYADSIFCIQRLKCSSIPVSRNILSDALGNETVINTAKVLGTEKYYAGSYGTDVPESVTQADSAVYFVSVRNKEVYRFNPSSGIEVISEKGMGSFFDSVLSAAEAEGSYKVTGGFDADQQEFILSVTAPLTALTNPALPAPINTVGPQDVSIQDFLDFEPVVGPVVVVNQEEIDQITELEQEVFNLQNENDALTEINEEQQISIQEFLDNQGVGGGLTQADLDTAIDNVVSTIIGAVGDGQLSPEDYDNPGPLTLEQLAAIDNVIGDAIDEARDEGADSVDLSNNASLNENQIGQLTSLTDSAAAGVDLGTPGVFGSGNLNSTQLAALSQYVIAAQDSFVLTDFDGLNEDQQEQYNSIIAQGVEELLTRFDEADPENLEATLSLEEASLYLEVRTSNDEEIANFAAAAANQSFYNQFSLQAVADAVENNDTTNFSQDVLDEYNNLTTITVEPFDFDDVTALFESGGVSDAEAGELLNALLASNSGAGLDADGDGLIGVPDLLGFLAVFGGPAPTVTAPTSIGDGTIQGPNDGVVEN